MPATARAAAAAPATQLIRGADLVALPWKNGGGVTREVAAFPAGAGLDDFIWRVSLADVGQAGPFSHFAGVERILVLLSGTGMILDEAGGGAHALRQPFDVARFAGEAAIQARLVDGPTRDFNLMLRRGSAHAEVDIWYGGGRRLLDADVALLFCMRGAAAVTLGGGAPMQLQYGDTLRIDAPQALRCEIGDANTDGDVPGAAGARDTALLAVSIRYA